MGTQGTSLTRWFTIESPILGNQEEVLRHPGPATSDRRATLRPKGHRREWAPACRGTGSCRNWAFGKRTEKRRAPWAHFPPTLQSPASATHWPKPTAPQKVSPQSSEQVVKVEKGEIPSTKPQGALQGKGASPTVPEIRWTSWCHYKLILRVWDMQLAQNTDHPHHPGAGIKGQGLSWFHSPRRQWVEG